MSLVSLSSFADTHGQEKAAQLLGVTQGALSKAIRIGRTIYVAHLPDGSYAARELRSFPSRSQKTA